MWVEHLPPDSGAWLIPQSDRPKVYMEHPVMSADEIRHRTQLVWDRSCNVSAIWGRSRVVGSPKARVLYDFGDRQRQSQSSKERQ